MPNLFLLLSSADYLQYQFILSTLGYNMYGMVYLVQALSPPLVQIEVLVMAAERGLQEIWDGFTNEGQRYSYVLGYYVV